MTDEVLQRDPELGAALADLAGDLMPVRADVTSLRHAINRKAASELARRRAPRRVRVFIPASLAAGIAVFLLVRGVPSPSLLDPNRQPLPVPSTQAALAGPGSIEELLDANVSDGQFRALVSGANDANDLLSIAAGESQ
jgi:hypothetical protein